MSLNRALACLAVALVAVGVVFAVRPGLDLAVSGFVYAHGGFWGAGAATRAARDVFRLAPFWLLGGLAALWVGRRAGLRVPTPSLLSLTFLVASLTLGSGLIVNLGLKDHSHRPRPVHVVEFGGAQDFRPWWTFDGACRKNCAFASGEAASGFWTIAPALLAPPPWRAAALAGAVAFGVAASALRIAFGGHFLSDVLMGGLISAIVVVALARIMLPLVRKPASATARSNVETRDEPEDDGGGA